MNRGWAATVNRDALCSVARPFLPISHSAILHISTESKGECKLRIAMQYGEKSLCGFGTMPCLHFQSEGKGNPLTVSVSMRLLLDGALRVDEEHICLCVLSDDVSMVGPASMFAHACTDRMPVTFHGVGGFTGGAPRREAFTLCTFSSRAQPVLDALMRVAPSLEWHLDRRGLLFSGSAGGFSVTVPRA